MKVLGLISSPLDPASRARIIQYGPYLNAKEVSLHCKYFKPLKEADPQPWARQLKKLTGINEWRTADLAKTIGRMPLLLGQSGFDLIWQNRLLQLHHSFWEKKLTKPVIFDFDDAIWLNEGKKQVEAKLQKSEMIFAGNEYLAEFANKHNKEVKIIPTVVDTDILSPLNSGNEKFTIGWIGTRSNYSYLGTIKQVLLEFLAKHSDSELMIVSSEMPAFIPATHPQVVFKQWSGDSENTDINQFSAGIMPLPDDEWTRGKCGYKLLQYLACGKPVVATGTGVNAGIIRGSGAGMIAANEEEWSKALLQLMKDPSMAIEKGRNGRKYVETNYSCAAWTNTIVDHMKSIL